MESQSIFTANTISRNWCATPPKKFSWPCCWTSETRKRLIRGQMQKPLLRADRMPKCLFSPNFSCSSLAWRRHIWTSRQTSGQKVGIEILRVHMWSQNQQASATNTKTNNKTTHPFSFEKFGHHGYQWLKYSGFPYHSHQKTNTLQRKFFFSRPNWVQYDRKKASLAFCNQQYWEVKNSPKAW